MTDRVMAVPPLRGSIVNIISISIDHTPRNDRGSDQGADRGLLDILQHADDHLAAARDHAQDRWLLLGQRPSARLPLRPASPPESPSFRTASGWPLVTG